jgi:hypothetical protein
MDNRSTADARASTVTRSFRFETEISDVLEEEAERMGVSVNALVNIVLKGYSNFTRYLSKIDMVVINREILTSLLDCEDEQSLYDLGMKLGQTVSVDTIMFWKKDLSEKSVLEYIEKIICRYSQLGTYDELSQLNGRIVVIRHRLGRKGSRFLEGYIYSTLKKTIKGGIVFEITDSSLKFQISYN